MSAIEALLGPRPGAHDHLPLQTSRTLLVGSDVLIHLQEDESRGEVTLYSVPGIMQEGGWVSERTEAWAHVLPHPEYGQVRCALVVNPGTREVFLSETWPRASLDLVTPGAATECACRAASRVARHAAGAPRRSRCRFCFYLINQRRPLMAGRIPSGWLRSSIPGSAAPISDPSSPHGGVRIPALRIHGDVVEPSTVEGSLHQFQFLPDTAEFVQVGAIPEFPPVLPSFRELDQSIQRDRTLQSGLRDRALSADEDSDGDLDAAFDTVDPYREQQQVSREWRLDKEKGERKGRVDPFGVQQFQSSNPAAMSGRFVGDASPAELADLHGLMMSGWHSLQTPMAPSFLHDRVPRGHPSYSFQAPPRGMPTQGQPIGATVVMANRRDLNLQALGTAPHSAVAKPSGHVPCAFFGDAEAAVAALKAQKAKGHQRIVSALQEKNSFEDMVKYTKKLRNLQQASQLLRVSRNWQEAGHLEASQLLAILFLFACHCPAQECRLAQLLPVPWPPGLQEWEERCFDGWRKSLARKFSPGRAETFALLKRRYPGNH